MQITFSQTVATAYDNDNVDFGKHPLGPFSTGLHGAMEGLSIANSGFRCACVTLYTYACAPTSSSMAMFQYLILQTSVSDTKGIFPCKKVKRKKKKESCNCKWKAIKNVPLIAKHISAAVHAINAI